MARALVYLEETCVLKVVGSNPSTIFCMDIFVIKILMFKQEKGKNEAGNGPFKISFLGTI